MDDGSRVVSLLRSVSQTSISRSGPVKGVGRSDRLVNFEINATAKYNPLTAEAAPVAGKKG